MVYMAKGQYEQALQAYSKAIQLSPEIAVLYNNRAGTYGYLGQSAKQKADEKFACYYAVQFC
jgi:cytochrome c-type biogenesis protein CcmH/NrfG